MSEQVFTNRYEIVRHLARGGMAEVYLARDLLLDRPVALKVLFPELSADPAFVERFRREAQAAANLNHPNIVSVYDWGEDENTYFIVMEYVEGPTLRDLLRREGRLHPERVADIGADIAAALSFAHRNGVIHRDVKPGNVLITSTGQVKVTDFGIARAARDTAGENLTQTGTVMGTATYFSPEQAQGKAIDPRSDVYSLGVVLYELVAGKPPFTGDNPVAIAYQHVQEAPTPPSRLNPDVPPAFEAIVMHALAKDANQRYASANDLRNDLLRFREGQSVQAETVMMAAAAPPADATQVQQAYADSTRIAATTTAVADGPPTERRTGAYIALMLVLLAALGILLFLLYREFAGGGGGGGTVAVPNVITKPADEAAKAIQDAGLKPKIENAPNEQVQSGVVFDQDPKGDTKVDKGSDVTLKVSGGAPPVKVANVVGMTVDDARDQLEGAGLVIEVKPQPDDNVPKDQVLAQDPAAGKDAPKGSTVTLTVSSGKPKIEVPDVSGRDPAEAANILGRAGFETTTVKQPSDTVPKDKVIGTNPAAGSQAEKGSTVTIQVSTGQANVTVPDVTGTSEDSAASELQSAGFAVRRNTASAGKCAGASDGEVVDQTPRGGTSAPSGSTVTIAVCRSATGTTTTTGLNP